MSPLRLLPPFLLLPSASHSLLPVSFWFFAFFRWFLFLVGLGFSAARSRLLGRFLLCSKGCGVHFSCFFPNFFPFVLRRPLISPSCPRPALLPFSLPLGLDFSSLGPSTVRSSSLSVFPLATFVYCSLILFERRQGAGKRFPFFLGRDSVGTSFGREVVANKKDESPRFYRGTST